MTKHKEWNNGAIDLLVGGTPCQSFSVAGLRKGLDDPRGNLMLTYLAIAEQYRAKWLVWENVPGVLSSNGGKDFGAFLGALGQLGYGFAYRVLDAQYFGVPQRRKRVFVVGCLRGWRSAAAVLFESHSLQGHSAPSREKGAEVSKTVVARVGGGGFDLDTETPVIEKKKAELKIRRMTPIEYERLQGFPDNYTQIAYRNKHRDDCPVSPRAKAMGNSMAVPVMKWIGERIEMVEALND